MDLRCPSLDGFYLPEATHSKLLSCTFVHQRYDTYQKALLEFATPGDTQHPNFGGLAHELVDQQVIFSVKYQLSVIL